MRPEKQPPSPVSPLSNPMRTALTVGLLRGSRKSELVHGLETPIHEQIAGFQARIIAKYDDTYEEIQLWESDSGKTKSFRPITKKEAKAKAKA